MQTLILADYHQQQLNPHIASLVTAAQIFEQPIVLLIAGDQPQAIAEQAAAIAGVSEVLVADAKHYQAGIAENFTLLVSSIISSYSVLLAPANTFGKNILPRIAASCGVSQLSEVVDIISTDTVVRSCYANRVLMTVKTEEALKVMSIRPAGFKKVGLASSAATITAITPTAADRRVTYSGLAQEQDDGPSLECARIIVAGGRAFTSAADFAVLKNLAKKLGAAVGASRALVDAQIAPNALQVGQTGKTVAPDLYMAIGISGAIQHLAGIMGARVIVAINRDPNATIFDVADYGLVGDWQEVIPKLQALL